MPCPLVHRAYSQLNNALFNVVARQWAILSGNTIKLVLSEKGANALKIWPSLLIG